jgi:hypothetical protein
METRGRKVAGLCEGAKKPTFGTSLDGVNPFSNQSLSHSTWPVVLLNYKFTTMASNETVFCDVNPNHSRKRKCERGEYVCVFSTLYREASKVVERGDGNRWICFGEGEFK